MANLTTGAAEHVLQFSSSAGPPLDFTVRFASKTNTATAKLVTVERAREVISAALDYVNQFPMGHAVLSTVTRGGADIRIWFCMAGSDALSPPNSAGNNTEHAVIKWCPLGVAWFYDCGTSTPTRGRTCFPPNEAGRASPFDHALIVRPNDELLEYDRGNPPYVIGVQSAAAVLLHELGHLYQFIRRPHYFTSEFIEAWRRNKEHLIHGSVHAVPEVDAPWEVDNVNWREQPFIKQARAVGLCEGYKSHYSDAVGASAVDDVDHVQVDGVLVPKVKVGDTWYHLNAAWKVTDRQSVKQLALANKGTEQQRLISGLGAPKPLSPSAAQIATCWDKFIKP